MAGPGTTDYAEVQQNEIQALESIYMENFEAKKSKPGAWNKTPDQEFSLKLGLSETIAEDILKDALITMHVALPATYPKSLPRCRLDFHPILPNSVRSKVTQILREKPKELVGSEMMYELASSVQEVLDDAAPEIAKAQEVPTLDEERAAHAARTELKAEQDRARQSQIQQAADDEEQKVLSEMVQAERSRLAKLRQRSRRSSSASRTSAVPADHVTFDQEIRVKDLKSSSIVAFRSVKGKHKYRKGPVTVVYTTEPVLEENGEDDCDLVLALKHCTLKAEKRDVQNLESRLESLSKLEQHANVLRVLAFRITKESQASADWSINILTPFADRRSLRDQLLTTNTIDITNMRSWTIQMLEGLHFLHQNHVTMARLSPDNVLLDTSNTGKTVIKLADAGFQQDLHIMYHNGPEKFSSAASSYWLAPETDRSQTKIVQSQDIWYLGVVLLQMLFGIDVQSQYNSPSHLINGAELSASFEDLVTSIFASDPKKRPSAFELLPDEFLRNDDPVFDAPGENEGNELTPMSTHTTNRITPVKLGGVQAAAVSRYASDFVESGRLGKGGFGEVVRARNKVDGTTYAIKKITQSSRSEIGSVLSEAMLFSRLNHPNIVRYYAAWVEEEGTASASMPLDDDESSDEDADFSNFTTSNTHGLDFISSSGGGPGIEFGYDSDEDSEAVEDGMEDSPSNGRYLEPTSARQRRRSSASTSAKVTLYIQMEYCEKQTLRDLLRDLYADPDQCWRLFIQIVSSLAYIHSNGVLHRDLKPDNIFITSDETDQPRIRLGDFGLARPGGASRKAPSSDTADPSLTASVGTTLYVAPEVRSSGGSSYNDKADMFALGIILFEMSYPLKTAMERIEVLTALRKSSFIYPEVFEEPEKQLQAEIIKSLLKPRPSQRPSSHDLLNSGRIPSHVGDEAIQAALQSLSQKGSPFFTQLMNGLFSQVPEGRAAKDLTYDMDLNLVSHDVDSRVLQSTIQDHLRSIFSRHGAVEAQQRQCLIPYSDLYSSSVRLLDASGTLVELPYDLTIPHARAIAQQPSVVRKSYSFGNVFRVAPAGIHPRTHGEFDFDIVTEDALDLALREAEVLKVIDEVIDGLPSLASAQVVFHITHSRLIEAILAFCGIPSDDTVKQVISRLNIGMWTWSRIRNELRGLSIGISSTSLDDLQRFNFREPYDIAIPKLRALLESQSDLESTFRHLEAVMAYMQQFNITRKVFIHPLGSINERFYRGNILFQCILDAKRKKVMCAGGRYDSLIQEFRTGAKLNRHAVGFNFGWDNVVESMAQWLRPVAGKQFLKKTTDEDTSEPGWKVRRCDVLVDSHDQATLRTAGISVVQELWAADMRAELVVDSTFRESASLQQANRDEAGDRYDWIVLVKQDGALKVRSNVRREDVELRRSELLGWLRAEIRDRDRAAGTGGGGPGAGGGGHAHYDGASGGGSGHHGQQAEAREASVTVLVAQHRSKKTNRRMVVGDALERTAGAAAAFLSAPIAAVELKDELFDALRDTRAADPDSWRRFAQAAPLPERQYIAQIHEMLEGARAQGAAATWVYNFRSKNCFLYDLGRGG